jgi:transposase
MVQRVIGVDVSKDRLDACDGGDGRRLAVSHDAAGVARLATWAGRGAKVAMEASGGYERRAHQGLT